MNLAYCDYIAYSIVQPGLLSDSEKDSPMISEVGKVKMDLAKEGWMQTTTKRIMCRDRNGKPYLITVEEINEKSVDMSQYL
tara:strand:+ start:217 stop:459 length:243 start_codon:yes stop_codon:yes gene_type:complete